MIFSVYSPPVIQLCMIDLGRHWFRQCFTEWRNNVNVWSSVDLLRPTRGNARHFKQNIFSWCCKYLAGESTGSRTLHSHPVPGSVVIDKVATVVEIVDFVQGTHHNTDTDEIPEPNTVQAVKNIVVLDLVWRWRDGSWIRFKTWINSYIVLYGMQLFIHDSTGVTKPPLKFVFPSENHLQCSGRIFLYMRYSWSKIFPSCWDGLSIFIRELNWRWRYNK